MKMEQYLCTKRINCLIELFINFDYFTNLIDLLVQIVNEP